MRAKFTPSPEAAARRASGELIAGTYARVSTRLQGQQGYSLGHQDRTLEEEAAALRLANPPERRYRDGEDENAGGARLDLPDLNRMLGDARASLFDVLLVPDLDRFARTLAKGLALEEQLREYGIPVRYQRVPIEDTPEGRVLKHNLFAFAEYEREKIALRTRMGRVAKARTGKVVGCGFARYGLRFTHEALPGGTRRVVGLEEDPETGPVAREILTMLRARPITAVVRWLNDRGVPSPKGGRWNIITVRRIARNRVYRGEWSYDGVTVPVAPLISPAEWDDVQAALDRGAGRRPGRGPEETDPFLLRGRLRCGHCGYAMHTVVNNRSRSYLCDAHYPSHARAKDRGTCPMPAVYAIDLEAECLKALAATIFDPAHLEALVADGLAANEALRGQLADRRAATERAIEAAQRRMKSHRDEITEATGPESKAMWRQAMAEEEKTIARLRADLGDLERADPAGLTPETAWALRQTAAGLRAKYRNLVEATPWEVRQLLAELDVRGEVWADPDGVALGKRGHRFRVDWTAHAQLLHNGTLLSTHVLLFSSPSPAPARSA